MRAARSWIQRSWLDVLVTLIGLSLAVIIVVSLGLEDCVCVHLLLIQVVAVPVFLIAYGASLMFAIFGNRSSWLLVGLNGLLAAALVRWMFHTETFL